MIKVVNGVATRETLPAFLQGLAPESLADLRWTDPALGVRNAAWWPEENGNGQLPDGHKWGAETLTPDAKRGVVVVTNDAVPLTAEEKSALAPQVVEMRQAQLALLAYQLLDDVEAAITNIPDPIQRRVAEIEWNKSPTVKRRHGLVEMLAPQLGLSDAQIDELFILAATL